MLCRKFELIPIKIGFFTNFQICSKMAKGCSYVPIIVFMVIIDSMNK